MKAKFFSVLIVMLALGNQARAGYMLSTVCLDTKGGAYLTERTVCYGKPDCEEIATPLACMNSNCANPKIDLTQLDPKGRVSSVGGEAIAKLTADLAFIMMQSPEQIASSPVYGVGADPNATLVCAPAMTASEFDAKGIEAKLGSH